MSTKPCPQCGAAVPVSARFCGQCGNTFADAPAHDEPTDPGAGAQTARNPAFDPARSHATPPAGSLRAANVADALNPASGGPYTPTKASAYRQHPASATMLGHAISPVANLPRPQGTLIDSSPFMTEAAAPPSDPNPTSQRPTPMRPPAEGTLDSTSVSTPQMRQLVEEELARHVARTPATPDARPGKFGQTLLLGGVPPVDASPAPGLAAPRPAAGIGPVANEPAPALAPPKLAPAHTMLGMPSVDLPPAPQPSAQQLPPQHRTMLGVAVPGIAPVHEPAPDPLRGRPMLGTLVGIAAPGIAPTGAAPSVMPAPAPPPPPIVPAPAPLQHEPLPMRPVVQVKKGGVPAIAVVGIVAALVLATGGAVAFFALRSGPGLTAQPQLDESGKESLRIQCESCADGTTVTLGASTATVANKTALLALPAPLRIGDNELALTLDRPAAGRDETVKVHVPVAYRVKADLTTLAAHPPAVTVRVEAAPGAEVTVDGKPLALDPSGLAAYPIDVTSEVDGPSDDQKTIDRKIPFTVKTKKDAAVENGQLVVRSAVAPLHLDAPGLALYTDHAQTTVAGLTKPGGTITVDGQGVAVDPQGHFGPVRIDLPPSGAKTLAIVANAPPLAPRTARVTVTRVPSLDGAAAALDARSPLALDAFAADPGASAGKLVVVDGEVIEVRASGGHTTLVVEEKKACTGGACVVRVSHGDELKASRGDGIRVYGRLLGAVAVGANKGVPDIEGELVLVRPAAKK